MYNLIRGLNSWVVYMTNLIEEKTMNVPVEVFFDKEANVWVATCDFLSIVTEGDSLELVKKNVYDLSPDMVSENNIILNGQEIHFEFLYTAK